MATTESSAVVRLINSVQAQPIFESFHEPIRDPSISDPTMPPLPQGTGTVVVAQRRRRRWPLLAFGAIALLGAAIGIGYAIGNSGQGPQAPEPMAGGALVPQPTEAEREVATEPVVEPQAATDTAAEAEAAVAAAPAVPETAPEQVFDASFDIIVEPAGATVSLDGKELGPSPLRIGRLAPGAHVVDVAAPEGYQSQRVELDLVSGERQVVRVELDPAAAEQPVVTGIASEPLPVETVEDDARDERRAERRAERRERRRAKRAERRAERKATPASKATKASGQATLMIGAKPPCKIFIDGKNTGLLTPQRSLKVPAGKHKILLVNSQHGIKAVKTVNVKAGETKRLIADLTDRM